MSSLAPLILQLCFCFLSSGSSGHEGKGQILPLVRLWLLDQVHQPLTEKVVSLMLTFPKDFANKQGQKKVHYHAYCSKEDIDLIFHDGHLMQVRSRHGGMAS